MYLGRKFKNFEEMREHNKQSNIVHYKRLLNSFYANPSHAAIIMIQNMADILVNTFGMTRAEVDALDELETI